jgi:hypothetical protein
VPAQKRIRSLIRKSMKKKYIINAIVKARYKLVNLGAIRIIDFL